MYDNFSTVYGTNCTLYTQFLRLINLVTNVAKMDEYLNIICLCPITKLFCTKTIDVIG